MMLLYKAWRESRTVFFGGMVLLTLYSCGVILRLYTRAQGGSAAYHQYVTTEIFSSAGKALFVLVVILLGPAGLLRERARDRAVFTLSLPVSRRQLLGAQLAVGLAEIALLALLAAVLVQPLSMLVGQSYPMSEALRFGFLRFVCGTEIYAVSFLLSTVVRGEYTVPVACFLALFLQIEIAKWSLLLPYNLNPLRTIDWGREPSELVTLPWVGLLLLTLLASSLFAIAARITERQNI